MWFFFPSLLVPPDPSLTICLTCLIIGNIVKIMRGCQLTTNCLTQSDPGELEIDGLDGLIGDSVQFLLSRYLCLQFYCNCWYRGHVILGSREILWRCQNCWCHLWNLLWLAKKAWSVKTKAGIFHWQHWLTTKSWEICSFLAQLWFPWQADCALYPTYIWVTKESSVLSWLYQYNCVWTYILIMCI